MSRPSCVNLRVFQSTSPVWGTTKCHSTQRTFFQQFQSTSPVWGTTYPKLRLILPACNFNPRPPCGGRPAPRGMLCSTVQISIHVPRVGDDILSTFCLFRPIYFNPRPPCGGRPHVLTAYLAHEPISIHVPRVGDDVTNNRHCGNVVLFQSTSPVWGTTTALIAGDRYNIISIHVPRVGDDQISTRSTLVLSNFNPRPPCGGRLCRCSCGKTCYRFQSTSPVWGTTYLRDMFLPP